MREDDVAGSLVAELTEQGEHVDDGRFTLDPAAALAKLRAHQLSDPHGYLLLLIEAAWIADQGRPGAGVVIHCGNDTTAELCCPGVVGSTLPDLFAAVFADLGALEGEDLRRARVLQLLGLAANNALALEPQAIRVEVCEADGSLVQLRVGPDGALALSAEIGDSLGPGWIRFTLVGDGLGLARVRAERALIRERCRYTRYPVNLDGESISRKRPAWVENAAVVVGAQRIGNVGYLGEQRLARIWVDNRGVGIQIPIDTVVPGLLAVVEADLPTDLSRGRLIEGPELAAIRRGIEAARATLVTPSELRSRRSGPRFRIRSFMVVPVLGFAFAMFVITQWSPTAPEPKVMLTWADQIAICEAGNQGMCVSLATDPGTRDPARFWRLACLAGDPPSCMRGLERSESGEEREAMLVRGCIGDQAEACERLLEPASADEPETRARRLARLAEVCEYGYRPACEAHAEAVSEPGGVEAN